MKWYLAMKWYTYYYRIGTPAYKDKASAPLGCVDYMWTCGPIYIYKLPKGPHTGYDTNFAEIDFSDIIDYNFQSWCHAV